MFRFIKRAVGDIIASQWPTQWKGYQELKYWKQKQRLEKALTNTHYHAFFTTTFGLNDTFYTDKRLLDIGCGPRGSLEWADMTKERVGLDPLADSYRRLHTSPHKMRYVASPAETMPFADNYFEVVSSFNSLDHVDDLNQVIAEIKRVLKPGGAFLLLTDVNHDPTPTEPVVYSWDIKDKFFPELELVDEKRYESEQAGLYENLREAVAFDEANETHRGGVLQARFRKPSSD